MPFLAGLLLGVAVAVALAAGGLLVAGLLWCFRNRDRVMLFVSTMPTTNIRIALTLLLTLATGARYLAIGVPEGEGWDSWLLFLVGMAGVDMAQFSAKRMTMKPELLAAGLTKESVTRPVAPGAATATIETPINVEATKPPAEPEPTDHGGKP